MKRTTSRYELLIFDWDGTVADSLHHIIESIHYAIDKLSFPMREDVAIKNIIGLGLEEALERLFPGINETQRKSMAAHYRECYMATSVDNISLFPGAENTIQSLHTNGHYLAVATGKSRRGLDRALEESGLKKYFHYTRCADETFSKPHPQMLEDIVGYFGTSDKKVLMIGDSEHDLQMAANAGLASAAVTYGAQEKEHLLQFEPVALFNSLRELPQWLAQP
jgi:phosphoglycolate phosphatase